MAVKIIKRNRLQERAEVLLQREVQHHERLRHEHIVRLYTWIRTPSKYYLVMEVCPRGDLLKYINDVRRSVTTTRHSPSTARPSRWELPAAR